MKSPMNPSLLALPAELALCAGLLLLPSCGGGGGNKSPATTVGGTATLTKLEFGRLVDIYSYRRVDPKVTDRRSTLNRMPVLVARDVVVSSSVETQALFDSVGEERTDADYRFLPFDVQVGHEELVVLWDDQVAGESTRFTTALQKATAFLSEVPASYRDQNTTTKPIPVVPRNAALQLTFDRSLGLDDAFFAANPSAVQLLEFKGDPKVVQATAAFRPVARRLISKGNKVVIDTTILGGEAGNVQTSAGLPISSDNTTANIRLALPVGGALSKQFKIGQDQVTALNGVDGNGDTAVVRDFRSGNLADGRVGALVDTEAPMIVANVAMGVIGIDTQTRVLTLNKRFAKVAVRARIPFVDGALASDGSLPLGPGKIPTDQPLRSGDILYQDVKTKDNRTLRLRSEILQVMDVGSQLVDPRFPVLGLDASQTDSGEAPTVRVKVASLTTIDPVSGAIYGFEADSVLPTGKDCTVRVNYYENVPYNSNFGNATVSDAGRRGEFLVFDPIVPYLDANRNPIARGTQVDPNAAVSLRFSEPMDLAALDPLNNFLLSNKNFTDSNFLTNIKLPKACTVSILAARALDQESNGALLRLKPPLGFHHEKTKTEEYWFHVLLGASGVKDLSGNALDVYDRRIANVQNVSFKITLDPNAADNWVGSRVYRFEDLDEDGTPPGSIDLFGQFRMQDGRLIGASTSRFSGIADGQTLPGILRGDKGECYNTGANPPAPVLPYVTLYQTPSMIAVQLQPPLVYQPPAGPQLFGGIIEPHQPRGARLQMAYLEDNFGLAYHDPNQMMLDVEQMYWVEWNGAPALFDTFDRYSLALGHSDWRPDLYAFIFQSSPMAPPRCTFECDSLKSGLKQDFAANAVEGSTPVDVFKDGVYRINPNESFKGATGSTFTPWPKFTKSYTWRDSRLVTWDATANRAIGLGGAHQPLQPNGSPQRDLTSNVSSPWNPNVLPAGYSGSQFVLDEGDFLGIRARDHDPIALPLLLDFKVYPDGATNGKASGANQFHIALIGYLVPINTGYYSQNPVPGCNGNFWPNTRAYTIGGFDPQNSQEVIVNPDETYTAIGGWIKDMGLGDPTLGLYRTKYADDHVHWTQADFVRKVSMATFGFFDTLKPNQSKNLAGFDPNGLPDFAALQGSLSTTLRIKDFVTVTDPPITAQPAGTGVTIEFRSLADLTPTNENVNPTAIYDKVTGDLPLSRGNILNPNYACEAFRYASPNSRGGSGPRQPVVGLTKYVVEEQLDSLRDPSKGFLPRYMNWRAVFTNNTNVTPATSPSLRSFSIVYRMSRFD